MDKIRILGHDYCLTFDPLLDKTRGSNGECCSNICRINIDSHSAPSRQKWTVIHEIIEGINYELELKLEHQQITALGASFFQVFADNPKLLEYLKQ